MPTPPVIEALKVHPTLQVTDIPEAVHYYTTHLGFTLSFTWGDPPGFAGIYLGALEIFLSRHQDGPIAGSNVFFVIEDADALYAFHRENGVEIVEPPEDRPYGLRDYSIRDPYGNQLVFGHHIYNTEPPIKIERVPVPVRLEKRLAALLADLAEHKKMSIDSCLEEMLLHSFEPYGDSVASPHTKTTLRYIAELKQKHGIDYDTHGSYRFVE